MNEEELKNKVINDAKYYASIAGLMDQFMTENITIYRNCRKLAVGKVEYLIYKGTKIWHISNIIAFNYEDIKELYYSLEEGYVVRLKG